jgi:hypothetical protein
MNANGIKIPVMFCALLTAGSVLYGENYLHHQIYASAMVSDPEGAAEELTRWAEQIGGYYVLKSKDRVVLRVPGAKISELKDYLETNTEELYEYLPSARDLREEILFLQSAVDSREDSIEENLEYLDKTDAAGTLAIEKEVMDLLKELENLKGRLKMLNQNRAYAYAEVYLSFQTQSLPEKLPSSFQWLSGLDFYSFIQRGLK